MDIPKHGMVKLTPHPTARSQARTVQAITAGSTVISVPVFVSALLDVEKGRRCDACFRKNKRLKKCSGCASYYYCNADCQSLTSDGTNFRN